MEKSNKTRPSHEVGMIRIENPDNLPNVKHYVIMVYVPDSRTSYEAPWHPRETTGTYSTTNFIDVQHWVTTNREVWEKKIFEMERGESRCGKGAKYSAFVVDKLASVKLNVSVDVKE